MVGLHHCFCNKRRGFFMECPADLCCLAFSFTYKTPWPICLCTGCSHKVCLPSLEREDPRFEFCTGWDYQTTANMAALFRPRRRTSNGRRKALSNKVSPLCCQHKESFVWQFCSKMWKLNPLYLCNKVFSFDKCWIWNGDLLLIQFNLGLQAC